MGSETRAPQRVRALLSRDRGPPADLPEPTVELGSGLGNVKAFIPNCVTTDVFPNPWIERVEDAYQLTFTDHSVSNLILFDVFHHPEFPGTALQEFRRVLIPGGRLIIFNPAMGLVGRFVFGCFHHEPLGLRRPITWGAPPGSDSKSFHYYAAQGNASRVFGKVEYKDRPGSWSTIEIRFLSGLEYVASGGFRGPQLVPSGLMSLLARLDSMLSGISWLSSRMWSSSSCACNPVVELSAECCRAPVVAAKELKRRVLESLDCLPLICRTSPARNGPPRSARASRPRR